MVDDFLVYQDWEAILPSGSLAGTYLTGEPMSFAYWKTLTAGLYWNNDWDDYFFQRFVSFYINYAAMGRLELWMQDGGWSWWTRGCLKLWRGFHLFLGRLQRKAFYGVARTFKTADRRLCVTEQGLIGLAPKGAKAGDKVVLCKGGRVPLVVREEDDRVVLVGDCYIHGIMKGELWDEGDCQEFWLK